VNELPGIYAAENHKNSSDFLVLNRGIGLEKL
jgi:hypothetical protein